MKLVQLEKLLPAGVPFIGEISEQVYCFDHDSYIRLNNEDGKLVHANRAFLQDNYEVKCDHPLQSVQSKRGMNTGGDYVPCCGKCGLELEVASYRLKNG